MRIESDRLILMVYTKDICEEILANNFEGIKKIGLKRGVNWPDDEVMETLPKILNNLSKIMFPTGFESWMIIKKDTMEIIGDVGFKGFSFITGSADIGYGIVEAERRKGYAEEAVVTLINWAFENESLQQITASCLKDNMGSYKLLEKLNFKIIGYHEDFIDWSLERES